MKRLSSSLRLLLLAIWCLSAMPGNAAEASRPNILFLFTDDQRDNTLGAMGHPFVKTPHLDALMQDSVRFKNAYIATPVCSPSRVSFFTGMPERVHGVGFSSSYDRLYRDIVFPLPPDTCTDPYHFIPQFIMDQDKGRRNQTYPYNYALDTCREHHIRYYQTITGLDHVIGGLLSDLKERGLDGNTIILFGSDHGLIMGEYGMGGKELLLDLSAKIPCIVHDPRTPKEQRGRQLENLVSSLDYTRTILDYADIDAPAGMEGRSLRPLVEGRDTPWREDLFLESLFTMRDNPFQEGIRTERWKYIRFYDGKMNFKEADVDFTNRAPEFELLFDLEADPTEHQNLAADPKHAAILVELRAKTAAQSIAINQRREAFAQANPVQPRLSAATQRNARQRQRQRQEERSSQSGSQMKPSLPTLAALLLAPMAQLQAGATTSLTQHLGSAADHPRSPLPAFVYIAARIRDIPTTRALHFPDYAKS